MSWSDWIDLKIMDAMIGVAAFAATIGVILTISTVERMRKRK